MQFSIIIPTYNAQAYLHNTLLNIARLKQHSDIELIIVDDGSTDNSIELAQQFCTTNSWATLYTRPHLGVSATRNYGITVAKGDYILFLDADDGYQENAIEIIESNLEQTQADILVFGATVVNHNSNFTLNDIEPNDVTYNKFDSDILFKEKGTRPYIWTCAYKRHFLVQSNVLFDTEVELGEDQLFQFGIFPRANKVQFISNKLYIYNYLIGNTTMSNFVDDHYLRATKHLLLVQKVYRQSTKLGDYDYLKLDLLKWAIDILMMDIKFLNKKQMSTLSRQLKAFLVEYKTKKVVSKLPLSKKIKLKCIKHYSYMRIYKLAKGIK